MKKWRSTADDLPVTDEPILAHAPKRGFFVATYDIHEECFFDDCEIQVDFVDYWILISPLPNE